MSEKAEKYYAKIEEYLNRDFFKKTDRKISFLIGKYYSSLAYKEKKELKTTSLYTKLPVLTKRLDNEQIYKLADKCNSVVKRLISKNKSTSKTEARLWEKLNDLLSKDEWESSHYELSLAFMMGFTFYVESEEENESEE
ncbi:MAG: hypothetical protein K9W46_04300 [Candidatus Heimdallarchaeum endolithica]|uniref:Uncharacterized protein n=1 Tax=Candidatus Heimdallarchaeum endolithica TaxID=2876572 RepID=A0A9Y1BT02_9ARCH|nr:MAG: hypothetical protein K9W46_04300 [Candidatus Heimdallarchaeum endolithica]